ARAPSQDRARIQRRASQALEQAHVRACAEAAACASDYDRAYALVVRGVAERAFHAAFHRSRPGIQLRRTVERDEPDAVRHVVADAFVNARHGSPSLATNALAGSSRPRQKTYEKAQSTPVPTAQPQACGPSPTAKWAKTAEPRSKAKPA